MVMSLLCHNVSMMHIMVLSLLGYSVTRLLAFQSGWTRVVIVDVFLAALGRFELVTLLVCVIVQ